MHPLQHFLLKRLHGAKSYESCKSAQQDQNYRQPRLQKCLAAQPWAMWKAWSNKSRPFEHYWRPQQTLKPMAEVFPRLIRSPTCGHKFSFKTLAKLILNRIHQAGMGLIQLGAKVFSP